MNRDSAEKILDFLEEIEKYSEQKILEFHSGKTHYPTNLDGPEKFEKYIIFGKLKTPAYLIKEEQIIANIIKKRYKFTPSEGWKPTQENIIFNEFLNNYFPRNSVENLQLQKLIDKSKATKLKSLEGLILNILPDTSVKIGGHTEYDSPEKASLIIGDKRVENYLKEEDLIIIKERVDTIPVF